MHKLLIVDDEEDIREFASNFFRRRKIEVITAGNGEEALEKLEKNPDLVLLDIQMSLMDGIETLEKIRQKNKDIKVIMVTGRNPQENSTYEKCKSLGVTDYIHKPLRLDELEKVVMKELRD